MRLNNIVLQHHAWETQYSSSPAGRRAFSQSAARQNYELTIPNLRIHKDTKVLCQGFTGKTVRFPCASSSFLRLTSRTGYFPCERSSRIWHENGRWCVTEKGWSNTSWPSCVWIGEGGTQTFAFLSSSIMTYLIFTVGCPRDTA